MSDNSAQVPHPSIPDWTGERSWTASGEPPSEFIVWDTDDDEQPFKVSHNRDMMMDRGAWVQDYNFIDYCFGDPAKPVTARFYLDSRDEVSVSTPSADGEFLDLQLASAAIPATVMQFLIRRFREVKVLTTKGYQTVWPIDR